MIQIILPDFYFQIIGKSSVNLFNLYLEFIILNINILIQFLYHMSDIHIGIPNVSGEFDIPQPYNSNDSLVVKKFICIYLCKEGSKFNRSNFLIN